MPAKSSHIIPFRLVPRRPEHLEVGCFYQVVGKTIGKGLPIPTQVIQIASRPTIHSALDLPCVDAVWWVAIDPVTRWGPIRARLRLYDVNIPPNGYADIELRRLGHTVSELLKNRKVVADYRDIMKEKA